MTKEECLNKHDTSRHYIEQTCRPELFAAMDEWAKLRSIEFNTWMDNNAVRNGEGKWKLRYDNWEADYTSEQAYDHYLTNCKP